MVIVETAPYLRESLTLNRQQHCRNTRYAEVNLSVKEKRMVVLLLA